MKQRLSLIRRTWRRLLVTAVVGSLFFLNCVCIRPRARFHWIHPRQRARRLERRLIVLLFLIAMILLEPREYAMWAAIWGGVTAIVVIFNSVFFLIPRKS